MVRIAPSLLAANFLNLASEVDSVERAGIDLLHIDVMDGVFVPNITMGTNVVSAIREHTSSELDVHLMIENPERYVDAFCKAGADMLSVHAEATTHLHRTIQLIKNHKVRAGVVINPATSVSVLDYIIYEVDFILVMTVNPGFGGQSFIPEMVDKIKAVRRLVKESGRNVAIEVDGGINPETLQLCREAGAELFVAGSAIFNEQDRGLAIQRLQGV